MSKRGVICEEPDMRCELCGKVEETRPYGPNGERVCYSCGTKDEAAMSRGIKKYIFGEVAEETQPEPNGEA